MANATLTGNASNNGATITNATDGSGVPSQNGSDVTLTIANATLSGTGHFYDVDFLGGNDSLIAWNMPWANPDAGDSLAFDNISMGTGDDLVELHRSAFYDTTDMGDGNDTLILDNSGGRNVIMGTGNDLTRVGMEQAGAASEEELAQKAGVSPLDIDGGTGTDTLNLVGDWTLTLSAGSFTLDTNSDGIGDSVTSILRSDQYGQVLGMPTLLSGTVQWGDTITLSGGDTVVAQSTFSNFEALNAVCFTPGTLIDTPEGPRPVETLAVGHSVITRKGALPVRWIGKRHLYLVDLMANPKLLPILIPRGAFGDGLPVRDMHLSPQHRIVVRSEIAERMFGDREVLVAAKQLVGIAGIEVDGEVSGVVYYHFMLDEHAVVIADGIEAETLYPGPQALSFVPTDARAEIEALFPDFSERAPTRALPFLKGRDARALAARHIRSGQPLWSS
ncbi:Hint domain-containing protein [Rhodobacter aestuarii]|uniref:Hint domain-containing protein n=1 Tax=Rhodobacter aestuarii TaxID=453582 RepID=A0A1N7QI99_9RHOB|nr:Hint domain-containing protein [Rhodobacter aestuarii]PTV93279.1 Hint domain-containing protein [Rhodobacter aestuarii]SIT22509.1 Hint domain-containing protein [Rhodobacter aestuarii]